MSEPGRGLPGQATMDVQEWIGRLLQLPDVRARRDLLRAHISLLHEETAATIKEHADQLRHSDIQGALDAAGLLFDMAEVAGNPLYRALGLLAEANVRSLGGLGEYERAVELYDEGAQIYRDCGRPVEQANTQVGRVYALAKLGRYAEALEAGRWAGDVLQEHAQWRPLAGLAMNLAIVYGRQRQDAQALAQFDRARELCGRLEAGSDRYYAWVEHNRAIVLRNLGRFEASIQASRASWETLERLDQRAETGRAREELAFTYLLLGRYNEALELLDQAAEIFLADGRHADAIAVELTTSTCLLQLRRFNDVLERCGRLQGLFMEQGTRREAGEAALNEAAACAGLRRYDQALALLARARQLFEQEGNAVWILCTDLEQASVLYRQGQTAASQEIAETCIHAFRDHDLPVQEAYACLVAARAAIQLGRIDLARQHVARALAVGDDRDVPTLVYQCHHLAGAMAQGQGNRQEALVEYDRAIEELERLRGRLMVEFRADFLEDKQVLYEDMVALCLDMDQALRGLECAERAKSRALLDLLAYRLDLSVRPRDAGDGSLINELTCLRAERDRLYRRWESDKQSGSRSWMPGDQGRGMVRQEVLALEKQIEALWHRLLVRNADYARDAWVWRVQTEPIQSYLEPGTLLIEYYTVRGQLVAFLVTAETVQARRLSVDLKAVRQLVQFLWLNLRAVPGSSPSHVAGLTANARGVLQRLYVQLVAPLEDAIASHSRLIVVPHGALHYLPFHALHDGHSYMLERRAISYLPGASLLRYCRAPRSPVTDVLIVGHSCDGALPYAVQEARAIAHMLDAQAVVEEEATLERFCEMAPHCHMLHLAAHGDFRPDNPLFSGLALSTGWLTTLDIFGLSLQASLVTLSACQTGRSVVGGGDELLGLMRAFLYAGAASLLLTLWTVEDRSTALLMQTFYTGLADGLSKEEALRSAQRALIAGQGGQDGGYAHPYYWAPFFLVGDAGPLSLAPNSH